MIASRGWHWHNGGMNTITTSWQPEVPSDYPNIADKILPLLQINSLTQGLKQVCADFSVRVLHLGQTTRAEDEDCFVVDDALFCREVELQLSGQAVVWARSVCLQNAKNWQSVLDCGTQSLGSILFGGQMQVVRSAFEYAVLPQTHVLSQAYQSAIYARRSMFTWQGETLLLQECYLPTLLNHLDGVNP